MRVTVAAALLLFAAAVAQAAASMQSIKVIQARVQGDQPEWNEEHGTFVSAYGRTFAEKYRAVFDSVNTASVEGALMYVQAEGINVQQNTDCKRKNNMQYIVFYELDILQPDAAMDAYSADDTSLPEYSPFVAMDGGACTPTTDATLPAACNAIFGGDGVSRLGPSVGASMRDTDPRAPYPEAVWFSFPNSCVMKKWATKDSPCRQQFNGGLCGYGSPPDGEICTFTYKTLGYINLDDLVGITFLTNAKTKQRYTNYTEFCLDTTSEYKGIEFSVVPGVVDNTQVTSLPFWTNPFNAESNRERTQHMVELYNRLAASGANHMTALPTPTQLAQENPPCHVNSKRCAAAPYGCKRELFAQICRVCSAQDEGCVKASYSLDGLQHGSDSDSQNAGDEADAPGRVVARNTSDFTVLDDNGNAIVDESMESDS